jgi:DNA-binding transcriptional ArsR family regulator
MIASQRNESPANLFRALGDDSRLQILQRLASQGPCPLSQFSHGLGISRQAVRKHVQILQDAYFVTLRPSGREVIADLNIETCAMASDYMEQLGRKWDQRLNALKNLVESSV